MHIQSYQIHNVLNEYYKRLSLSPGSNGRPHLAKQAVKDNVQVSQADPKQTIMDQVSDDIIQRITQYGPQNRFNETLSAYMRNSENLKAEKKKDHESEFVYTAIDENNNKSIQTLPIDDLNALMNVSGKDHPKEVLEDNPTKNV
jgi:hypothetical protein